MTVNPLFLRKLLVAFLVGAAPALLAFVSSVGTGDASFTRAALLTLASGAVGAGLRAALVLIPGVNLVPSDAQPVITKAPEK
jgi:hypothetical protein